MNTSVQPGKGKQAVGQSFCLPDLGEGLIEAQIRECHVQPGDQVQLNQPLLAVETAKAIVDLPAPWAGVVTAVAVAEGDTVKVGQLLLQIASDEAVRPAGNEPAEVLPVEGADQGAIVGQAAATTEQLDDHFSLGTAYGAARISPAVQALADTLAVDVNLLSAQAKPGVVIGAAQVRAAATEAAAQTKTLDGHRKRMAAVMSAAHAQVVPVTIWDQADVSAWADEARVTAELVMAICHACQQQPLLNAWYDNQRQQLRVHERIHMGIAVDTEHGLQVPVLRDAQRSSKEQIAKALQQLISLARNNQLRAGQTQGATISLSNFGSIAGRYGTPVVVPPMVAIVGVGRRFQQSQQRCLPLSLSFDHRVVTGGEASRFLRALMDMLEAR